LENELVDDVDEPNNEEKGQDEEHDKFENIWILRVFGFTLLRDL